VVDEQTGNYLPADRREPRIWGRILNIPSKLKSQIRMVAGFAEVIEGKDCLVAGGGFEPPTFGL
jgi:hypothetical protein